MMSASRCEVLEGDGKEEATGGRDVPTMKAQPEVVEALRAMGRSGVSLNSDSPQQLASWLATSFAASAFAACLSCHVCLFSSAFVRTRHDTTRHDDTRHRESCVLEGRGTSARVGEGGGHHGQRLARGLSQKGGERERVTVKSG
jgi:hypothetical protein